jgi:phospholipid/cholesterol/gamma-HCH transport system ATP-binding protein
MKPHAALNATQGALLSLKRVRVRRLADQGAGLLTLDLTLGGGGFHLIYSGSRDYSAALADTCLGLIEPDNGVVSFLGQDWRALDQNRAHALRGHVGRVMTRGNWIETRSIMENIVLPQRHSTHRSDASLNQEAARLAQRFGLPGLPIGYPDACLPADLERAACTRAFMGRPLLVILEHPMELTYPELLPALINAGQKVRKRGGAVLWITSLEQLFEDRSLPTTQRHRIVGGALISVNRSEI